MDAYVSKLTTRIYLATVDPEMWQSVLTEICAVIEAAGGLYAMIDLRQGRHMVWHAVGESAKYKDRYLQQYLHDDPGLPRIIGSPGKVYACTDYLSDEDVAGSRFHQEFLLPANLRYVLSSAIAVDGGMASMVAFQRRCGQFPFDDRQVDFLERLIPHFVMAERISAHLTKLANSRRWAMDVLDRLDFAIVIANASGMIRMSNQRAEQLFQSGQIMRVSFGRLHLVHEAANLAFARALKRVCVERHESAVVCGGNDRKIVVLPISTYEQGKIGDSEASVVITITDGQQQRALAPKALQHAYGLTEAETRVALGIAAGQTPDELCASLFVSITTIKTHLQRVFQKTGVCRQVDLVRLIYGLPAVFTA